MMADEVNRLIRAQRERAEKAEGELALRERQLKQKIQNENMMRTHNSELREALEWYGDDKHYRADIGAADSPVEHDNGKRARDALKGGE